jgi:hypothetical protein
MEISSIPEFEGLKPRIQSELETTLKERAELGLSSPSDVKIITSFYNTQGALATARRTQDGSEIHINVGMSVMERLGGSDREKMFGIQEYFDKTRDFLSATNEKEIFEIIEDPEKYIKKFEQRFPEKGLSARQNFLKELGEDYETRRKYVINNAPCVKHELSNLFPKISKEFEMTDLCSLRHEMDHVDFFNCPFIKYEHSLYEDVAKLYANFDFKGGDKNQSLAIARANMDILQARSQSSPLLEARAFFFTFVKPGQWANVDFSAIGKSVYEYYSRNYIEAGMSEEIIDKLISVAWSEGKMDRQTSNFLFHTVNKERGSVNADRYVVNPGQVNYAVADNILYKEFPEWQNIFATNAKKSVDVISNAYASNPSRLREANRARTFEEYLELCKQ